MSKLFLVCVTKKLDHLKIQQILGISRPTAYNLIKRNGFQSIRTDKGIRVIKTSFDAWLDSNI